MNNFNILDFAGLSQEKPWELKTPTPTDLRAVISGNQPNFEATCKTIATFIGQKIEAEPIEPEDSTLAWASRIRIDELPTDFVLWVEPLDAETRKAAGIDSGWILAVHTLLHPGDPITHFSNLMRLLGGAKLNVHSICDLPTGRWFPKNIVESVFVNNDVEPAEDIMWIARLIEAPEDGEPEDRFAWISTHGLTRCGRVELEMFGVPGDLVTESVDLIDGLAALTLENPLPQAGQPISIGSDLLVSLMEPSKIIPQLQDGMPGKESHVTPSVAIVSHDGGLIYPKDALHTLKRQKTTVMKTTRSTNRQSYLARASWNLLVKAATQIGKSEHAACLVQIAWSNTEEEDAPREYLWFRIIESAEESVVGTLAHTPALVTSLNEGYEETITADDITDWIVMTPVGPMGPSDAEGLSSFLDQFIN